MKSLEAGRRSAGMGGIYAFLVLGSYLAGANLGGWAQKIFLVVVLVPAVSLVFTLLTRFRLLFSQEFSTDHPHKGERIQWIGRISNPLPFWSAQVRISMHPVPGSDQDPGPGLIGSVSPKGQKELDAEFACTYRGVYTLGIRKLEVLDPLFGFALPVSIHPRSFYVSPRTYALKRRSRSGESLHSRIPGPESVDASRESSNLNGLREYAPGFPMSRIHWRSLARYNKPYVVEYEGRSRRHGVVILDTRSWDHLGIGRVPDSWRIPSEDTAIEAFFSLIRAFREDRTPCRFAVPGWTGRPEHELEELLRRSTSIFFEQQSDVPSLLGDPSTLRGASEVHFVSPILDKRCIEAGDFLSKLGLPGGAWICVSGYPEDFPGLAELRRLQSLAPESRERSLTLLRSETEIAGTISL